MSDDQSKDDAQVNRLLMRLGELRIDINNYKKDVAEFEESLKRLTGDLTKAEVEFRNTHAELIKIEPLFDQVAGPHLSSGRVT